MKKEAIITNDNSLGQDEIYVKFYKCSHCGAKDVQDDFNFCPKCGYKLIFNLNMEK